MPGALPESFGHKGFGDSKSVPVFALRSCTGTSNPNAETLKEKESRPETKKQS